MLYTIGTSNNYPNRAYGAFRSVKGSITDYLTFEDPAPIHLNIRIDFTDFEAIFFYNEDSLRSIWVEEAFMKKYKKEKLKGWTFYPEEG